MKECPYGADKCPKIEATEKALDALTDKMDTIMKIMYIMCGIIAIQTGLVLI